MSKTMLKPKLKKVFSKSNASPSTKNKYTNCCKQRQEKTPTLWLKNLKLYLSQYCESTTIHGIKYVGQRGRYVIEKLIWIIVIAVIGTMCLVLIQKTYIKWNTSPVIVTFATTETQISKIPFPAVTICPEVKFDPAIFNFTAVIIKKYLYNNLTKKEEDDLESALLVCDDVLEQYGLSEVEYKNHTTLEMVYHLYDRTIFKHVPRVKWLGKGVNMGSNLTYILTTEGVCYNFNRLPEHEIFRMNESKYPSNSGEKIQKWSLEGGYNSDDDLDNYPRRTFLSGIEGGLTLDMIFTNHSHLDVLCKKSQHGYKVILHHPAELPNIDNHFRLSLDYATLVAVKPTMITVSNEILHYKPQYRQCYFAGEKYLSMFKLYTQQNCLVECLVNYTLSMCRCFPFHLSLHFYHSTMTICGPGANDCVRKCKLTYLKIGNSSNLSDHTCGCLPSCTSLSYEVETSETHWDWNDMFDVLRMLAPDMVIPNTEGLHFSRLVVYYKDLQFLSSTRKELYGLLDFVSNMGGLLGLFIGFSVTSVIEILYFCTLRIICNVKKYGTDMWCGEPELMKVN